MLRDGGDDRQLAAVLRSLANVALERSDFSQADALLTESRDRARSGGHSWEVAASANLLGLSQTMQGSPDWAIERHREAVETLQIEWCIRAAAVVAALRGAELERATRLFSASETMREETGIALRIGIGETVDLLIEEVRQRLGADRFARGWQIGLSLTPEQSLDEARLVFEKAAAG